MIQPWSWPWSLTLISGILPNLCSSSYKTGALYGWNQTRSILTSARLMLGRFPLLNAFDPKKKCNSIVFHTRRTSGSIVNISFLLVQTNFKIILIHIGACQAKPGGFEEKDCSRSKSCRRQQPIFLRIKTCRNHNASRYLGIKNCRNQFGAAAHKQKPGLIIPCHCEVRASKKFPLI